jgi:hypothetical protein
VFVTFFFKGVYKKSTAERLANEAADKTHEGEIGFVKFDKKIMNDSVTAPLLINS